MNVSKSYMTAEKKCSSLLDDNVETKYALFSERCDQASVPHDQQHLAFSAVFVDCAPNFYSAHIEGHSRNIHDKAKKLLTGFVIHESILALTREWENKARLDC